MEIKQDMDFRDLENNCWGQAVDILKEISDADKEDALMNYLEEIYYDEIPTLTEINDVLAYDWENVYKDIGMFNLEDEVNMREIENFKKDCETYKKPRMITNSDMEQYSDLEDGEVTESELSEQIDEITDTLSEVLDAIDSVLNSDDEDDFESAKDDLESACDKLDDLLNDYVDSNSKVYKDLYNKFSDLFN